MINALVSAVVTPPLMVMQLILGFSWPAAVVVSGVIALIVGGLMAVSYGTKEPRWFLLPLLLAHVHVFAVTLAGPIAFWPIVALEVLGIAWLLWVCRRETLLTGLLLGWFCAVYCGANAVVLFNQLPITA